jgi:hypothetical protein
MTFSPQNIKTDTIFWTDDKTKLKITIGSLGAYNYNPIDCSQPDFESGSTILPLSELLLKVFFQNQF